MDILYRVEIDVSYYGAHRRLGSLVVPSIEDVQCFIDSGPIGGPISQAGWPLAHAATCNLQPLTSEHIQLVGTECPDVIPEHAGEGGILVLIPTRSWSHGTKAICFSTCK